MYARVTTINVRPDKVEEAVGITSDSVLAAAKEQPGFKGMHLLSNRETCRGVAITFWETREHLEASEKSGYYGEQVDRFSEILTGPPEMEVFEVDISRHLVKPRSRRRSLRLRPSTQVKSVSREPVGPCCISCCHSKPEER